MLQSDFLRNSTMEKKKKKKEFLGALKKHATEPGSDGTCL